MKQLIFILMAVVVLGGLYLYVESQKVDFTNNDVATDAEVVTNDSADEGETDFVPTDITSGMRFGKNAITSQVQRPGKSVNISKVYLAVPGYVVIYADTNGEDTPVLGSSALLPAGESSNVTVPISRATTDGETLWSVLHIEANGDAKFNVDVDIEVQDDLGESISSYFEIKTNAQENASITL